MFDVLLSVELQRVFRVDASTPEGAVESLKRRWEDGTGDDAITHDDLEATNVQFDVVGGSSVPPNNKTSNGVMEELDTEGTRLYLDSVKIHYNEDAKHLCTCSCN